MSEDSKMNISPEEIAKEYKKEQQKRMSSFVIGATDFAGNRITKIFAKGDEYVFYEVDVKNIAESLKLFIDSEIEDDKTLIEKYNSFRVEFTKAKSFLNKSYDNLSSKAIISQIAAYGLSENSDPEKVKSELKQIVKDINEEYSDRFNRTLVYLFTSIIILISAVIFSWNINCNCLSFCGETIKILVYIATAGCAGGFVSISYKIKKTTFDQQIFWYKYVFYSVERMLLSIVASIVVFFAVKSNLIFGFINEVDNQLFGLVVIAVAAGFSETLLPNFLVKLENDQKLN